MNYETVFLGGQSTAAICPRCGAMVYNRADEQIKHNQWHDDLDDLFKAIHE
jgi:uncharacterized C2H2 Zn-finger protein